MPPPVANGDPFAALLAQPATCSGDHWCWRTPSPSGNDYARVFSTAPNNIWLIGAHGTVLQWDGAAWHAHNPPQQAGLPPGQYAYAIAGLGPSDMWLLTGATVQHWDGTAWTILDSLPANGIHGFDNIWEAPNGDVWVTRNDGMVDRSIGGKPFQSIDTGCNCFLGAIWGLAADDFWMSTLPGGILHGNGHTFTPAYSGSTPIGSFTGVAPNDVWISGSDGAILHWDGTAWTLVPSGLTGGFTGAVAAVASNDVWWWYASDSSTSSAFVHWDGTALSVTPVDTSALGVFIYSGAIIDGRWWLVGGSGAVYTKASASVIKPIIDPNVIDIEAMWGPADDDMYFATAGEVRKWDGHALQIIQPMTGAGAIGGIHTATGDELFATGFELTDDRLHYIADAYHYDGTAWTKTQLDQSLIDDHRYFTKLWAMAPGEAMAVGFGGLAYHYANGVWNPVATGVTTDLVGVWGPDPDHVWITGPHGTLLLWNRASPGVAVPDPSLTTSDDLGAIHGAGGVTWIADAPSSVLYSTPSGWTKVSAGVSVGGLFAVDATDVVVASSGQSQLARWNGSKFVLEDNGAGSPTSVLFQPPGGAMLAGGLDVLVQHP